MSIVVTLSPELENLLYDRVARQGQEVGFVASPSQCSDIVTSVKRIKPFNSLVLAIAP
jgi:hypothetical protein